MLTRADLLLPDNFSGVGMHYDPESLKDNDSYYYDALYRMRVDADFALMHWLGITVVTVLNAPDYIYQIATRYGMLILNRPFRRPFEPWTNDGDPVQTARRNGHAALVQVNNEDELVGEWEDREINWYISRQNLIEASCSVYDQGGIVCWQMLDFSKKAGEWGATEDHYGYFEFCVDGVREQGAERIFENFMLITHGYGINHLPNYTQDENGFLGFLIWAIICQRKLGFVPLMISGEWGWGLNESADDRFPPVSAELRNQYEMSAYKSLKTGILPDGSPLPDYFLGCCKWIWHARGRTYWEDDAIIKADGSRREDFIDGLIALGKFKRKFSDDIDPEPAPVPEPEVPPMPEFLYAFKAYVLDNPTIDVGEPAGDQIDVYPDGKFSLQVTTRGLFVYQYGVVVFLPGAVPKA